MSNRELQYANWGEEEGDAAAAVNNTRTGNNNNARRRNNGSNAAGVGAGLVATMSSFASGDFSGAGSLFRTLFWGALALFGLFLLLLTIHYTVYPIFSFSPEDGGLIPLPVVSDARQAFSKEQVPSDVPLFPNGEPASCDFTIAMDVLVKNEFTGQKSPRILLYRAPAPVQSADTSASIDTAEAAATYLKTALPATNFALWLHPINNDLYFSAVTAADETGTVVETTAPPLENVPVGKVFRLTVVFTQAFVELYMNGRLQRSFPFRSPPRIISSRDKLFALAKPTNATAPFNVAMSNVSYWDRHLTAREVAADGQPKVDAMFFTPSK